MAGGYMGRILRIDLSRKKTEIQDLDEATARKYIGGSGLGVRILYNETSAKTDPLGPDNVLILMTGPFAGTPVPTAGRHALVAKSPLTGIFGESDVGGTWGFEIKRAGYDGVVVTGRSEEPVYIWINDGRIEIRSAEHLWGKDTYEAEEILRKETHQEAKVSCIGPAGERLVLLASVMHDGRDGRAAARCGLGAVMGSKNLKAIVVKGSQRIPVAQEEKLLQSLKEAIPMIRENTQALNKFGTASGVMPSEKEGNFPIQNWRLGRWKEGVKKICGPAMTDTILVGKYHCRGCPIGCGRLVKITQGPYAGVEGAGPEYETLGMLGGLCLVDNLEAIAMANELCNRYGMDTISVGAVIAFGMEAYEKGLINKGDTGGIELTWGNHAALVEMVRQIGERKGWGEILGQGVKKSAEKIGGCAQEFALQVKGLEIPAHDARAYFGMALGYATSSRGACHLSAQSRPFENFLTMPELGYNEPQNRHAVEGKAELVAKLQHLMGMFDSLKGCRFLLFGGVKAHHLVEWLSYVTGWEVTLEEFMKTGERIFNLKRLYNVRCGISRKDDILPPRLLTLKRRGEGLVVNLPPLGKLLSDYYEYRGWSEEGIPLKEKLIELGLEAEIPDIYRSWK